jgi:predicted AAA+ superfamily ATPase
MKTVTRILQSQIEKNLFTGKPIIIYGARQVGKTTLVKNIANTLDKKFLYLNADGETERKIIETQNIQQLSRVLKGYKLLIIDEAQQIAEIGKILKIIHDSFPEIQIIATGSSSFDLANKVSEPMTGRVLIYTLYPLSYGEIRSKHSYLEIQGMLQQLLLYGNYPDVFTQNQKNAQRNIQLLAENYLYRDVLMLGNIKKPAELQKILQLLAYQIGSEVSYSEIAQKLGMGTQSVQHYIDLLEKSFIVFRVHSFSRNLRNELSKSVKIFFYDCGVRNALINNFQNIDLRPNAGALWENFVISERVKFLQYTGERHPLFFWRTYAQQEIDIIEEKDGKISAFEIKWNNAKKIKFPKSFQEAYPHSDLHKITPENLEDFVM